MTLKPAHLRWKDNGTPESTDFGDIYFSIEDGMAETRQVFIEGCNAHQHWQQHHSTTIGETGFGTGLNFLTTWHDFLATAPENHRLNFISFEGFPLTLSDLKKAHSVFPELAGLSKQLRQQYPPLTTGFHRMVFAGGRITLTLINGLIDHTIDQLQGQIDCWYLDGFAPSKNPDMWTEKLFQNLYRLSHKDTKLATFTAAGIVKRGLEGAGFEVQKTKGFGKKRDRIIATIKKETTSKDRNNTPSSVTIIGAGIAGSLLAFQLKQQGLKATIIEASKIGAGASGNPAGLISPKIILGTDPQADFMSGAYMFAHKFYQQIEEQKPDLFILTPKTIKKASTPREQEQFNKLATKIDSWYHHYLTPVEKSDRSYDLSIKSGFTVRPDKLTKYFAGFADEILFSNVTSIKKQGYDWCLYDQNDQLFHQTRCLVITAGHQSKHLLKQLDMTDIAISHSRGQVSLIKDNDHFPAGALYKGAYLTPPFKHPSTNAPVRLLGASFDRDTALDDPTYNKARRNEHNQCVNDLFDNNTSSQHSTDAIDYRISTRAMMVDHMPLMGAAYDKTRLTSDLPKAPEVKDLAARLPNASIEGLYVLTGLGSRGLMTAPLLTTCLADIIATNPPPISSKVLYALNPARFLIKDIVRGKKPV